MVNASVMEDKLMSDDDERTDLYCPYCDYRSVCGDKCIMSHIEEEDEYTYEKEEPKLDARTIPYDGD